MLFRSLVETTVLVDCLRGDDRAAEYLDAVRSRGRLLCSAVTVAELIVGTRDRRELRMVRQLITRLEVEPITATDSACALKWLSKSYHSRGVGFHDCLIAASAVRLHVPVATLNEKHFRSIPTVKVVRPY